MFEQYHSEGSEWVGCFFSAELVFLLFLLPVLGQKAPCSGSHRAVCVISPAPSQHSSTPPWKSPGCWVNCVISANKWVILHLLMLPEKAIKLFMWNFRCLVQTDWLSLNTYTVQPRWRCLFFCKLPDERVLLVDGCSSALTVGKNWPLFLKALICEKDNRTACRFLVFFNELWSSSGCSLSPYNHQVNLIISLWPAFTIYNYSSNLETLKIQGEPTMTLSNMPVYAVITDRNRWCCCCNEYPQRSFMQWLIAIYI